MRQPFHLRGDTRTRTGEWGFCRAVPYQLGYVAKAMAKLIKFWSSIKSIRKIMPLYRLLIPFFLAAGFAQANDLLSMGSQAKRFMILNQQQQYIGLRNYIGNSSRPELKYLILNFWSTSCIPCRTEIPVLQQWVHAHSPQVEALLISVDPKDRQPLIERFAQTYHIDLPILLDFYQTTGKSYGVCSENNCSVPSLFVMDSQGIIQFSQTGFESPEELLKNLEQLFKKTLPVHSSSSQTLTETLSPAQKQQLLHHILDSLPYRDLARQNDISSEQLMLFLRDIEKNMQQIWVDKHEP